VITIADLRAHDAAISVLTMGGIRKQKRPSEAFGSPNEVKHVGHARAR